MAEHPQDLLVIDLIGDGASELGASLTGFAADLSARYGAAGGGEGLGGVPLVSELSARWSVIEPRRGLEVFDPDALYAMAHDWSIREGYRGEGYDFDGPFVIPVDPMEAPTGLDAAIISRGPAPSRQALRPIARPTQLTPRRAQPKEQWRLDARAPESPEAAPSEVLSPYPEAMGRAGGVLPQLLRFPDARAQVRRPDARRAAAVIVEPQGAPAALLNAMSHWGDPGEARLPALTAAVSSLNELAERWAPEAPAPASIFLTPEAPAQMRGEARPASLPGRARLGRWREVGARALLPLGLPPLAELEGPMARLAEPELGPDEAQMMAQMGIEEEATPLSRFSAPSRPRATADLFYERPTLIRPQQRPGVDALEETRRLDASPAARRDAPTQRPTPTAPAAATSSLVRAPSVLSTPSLVSASSLVSTPSPMSAPSLVSASIPVGTSGPMSAPLLPRPLIAPRGVETRASEAADLGRVAPSSPRGVSGQASVTRPLSSARDPRVATFNETRAGVRAFIAPTLAARPSVLAAPRASREIAPTTRDPSAAPRLSLSSPWVERAEREAPARLNPTLSRFSARRATNTPFYREALPLIVPSEATAETPSAAGAVVAPSSVARPRAFAPRVLEVERARASTQAPSRISARLEPHSPASTPQAPWQIASTLVAPSTWATRIAEGRPSIEAALALGSATPALTRAVMTPSTLAGLVDETTQAPIGHAALRTPPLSAAIFSALDAEAPSMEGARASTPRSLIADLFSDARPGVLLNTSTSPDAPQAAPAAARSRPTPAPAATVGAPLISALRPAAPAPAALTRVLTQIAELERFGGATTEAVAAQVERLLSFETPSSQALERLESDLEALLPTTHAEPRPQPMRGAEGPLEEGVFIRPTNPEAREAPEAAGHARATMTSAPPLARRVEARRVEAERLTSSATPSVTSASTVEATTASVPSLAQVTQVAARVPAAARPGQVGWLLGLIARSMGVEGEAPQPGRAVTTTWRRVTAWVERVWPEAKRAHPTLFDETIPGALVQPSSPEPLQGEVVAARAPRAEAEAKHPELAAAPVWLRRMLERQPALLEETTAEGVAAAWAHGGLDEVTWVRPYTLAPAAEVEALSAPDAPRPTPRAQRAPRGATIPLSLLSHLARVTRGEASWAERAASSMGLQGEAWTATAQRRLTRASSALSAEPVGALPEIGGAPRLEPSASRAFAQPEPASRASRALSASAGAVTLDVERMIRRDLEVARPQMRLQASAMTPLSAQDADKFTLGAPSANFERFGGLTPASPAPADPHVVDFVTPPAPQLVGKLFGDRGPVAITAPDNDRVIVETGATAATEQALRSTPGERPQRKAETNEEARHRLAAGQIDDNLSPEEVERIAEEVVDQLRSTLAFDNTRIGEDEWD